MTRIDADWLTRPETQSVFTLFSDAGHEAYAVGGAVRNTLLGRGVSDIDIATSAEPEEMLALAKAAGIKAIATGFDHGTVTLVVGDLAFEITTYRHDVETDGRRALVAFTDSLVEDARRRDFTMNALYAAADGAVVDPVHGLEDLNSGRVVFVGDPVQRIEEDYLRILRFFRFYAEYGDPAEGPDVRALAAIAEHLDGLEQLARERIGAEMRKLLGAPDPVPALATMEHCGVLGRVLPGSVVKAIAPLIHLESETDLQPDWLTRLAALGAEAAPEALRLSRAETRAYTQLQKHLSNDTPLREIAWRDGASVGWSVTLIRHAGMGVGIDPGTGALIARASTAEFPLKPADLMPDYEGPALGAALAKAEKLWIESDFDLDRSTLLEEVRRMG